MKLAIVKSELFGNVQCDFWKDENGDIWMTRDQIGAALEYSDPRISIGNIHNRNKDRLDKFSAVINLITPQGKKQKTTVYHARGIYELCRWSRQPKADAFYDMVYDLLESLRKGETLLVDPVKRQELEIKRMNAEARLLNAKTRQAMIVLKSKDGKTLHPKSVELLEINAVEVLTGGQLNYRPEIGKMYTAEEIGKEAGVSKNKVGRIANANGLKTDQYGMMVLDKSKHSDKQVETFRYNEEGRSKILDLLRNENSPSASRQEHKRAN
jgi:prophage antirepressor-like protein